MATLYKAALPAYCPCKGTENTKNTPLIDVCQGETLERLELNFQVWSSQYKRQADRMQCQNCGNYLPLTLTQLWEKKVVRQVMVCHCNGCRGAEVQVLVKKVG